MSNYPLPLSVVRVSGEDAIPFLQGQLTQDIEALDKQWKYAAQCNPQGRVIAFFIVFKHEENTFLITDKESCKQTLTHLQKYVMRSKVVFSETDEFVYFIENDNKESELDIQFNANDITLNTPMGDLLVTSEATTNENSLSTINVWQQANIKNGIPFLTGKALGKFTPEALNLDLLGAVSFTKGCYTGQEIVARMHYLGKAKKRLFITKIIGKVENIRVGDNITDKEGKTIGHLVNCEKDGNALISIKTVVEPTFNKNNKTIQSINNELLL